MSGLDPVAALASAAIANAQAAIADAALNLGALLEEFRAQITVGEVLTATVLPAENGIDRISVLGQTLPAQLPPGINPGEKIALQVTGFTNTAILVRNLGILDPSQAPPQAQELPQPTPGSAQSAVLSVKTPAPAQVPAQQVPSQQASLQQTPSQQAPSQQTAAQKTSPVAPPRELFVAASVQQLPQQVKGTIAPALPESIPAQGETPTPPADVETRIAASRAAPLPAPDAATTAKTPEAEASVVAQQKQLPLTELLAKTLTPPILVRNVVPRTDGGARAASVPGVDFAPAPQQAHANATVEGALLTRLRVPLSGTTLAAARLIETATQSVSSTYQKLDALLAKLVPEERVSSLRALLSFVGRIDLRNARAMPEQIAAYVSNVVTGAESKIAQIVRAWSQGVAIEMASSDSTSQASAQASPGSPAERQPGIASSAGPTELADLSTANVARVAERAVALQHDLKSALLQLVANPPSGASPQVVAALREALTATTAVQLNALNLQQNTPNAITIALPAYFHEDGRPAQLRINKDAPDGKKAIDADNFHIAFILDTASLGTVAIDLQTVGREVRLDVKTEASRSADRFRSTLPQLGSRLEALHYRVASMAASMASRLPEVPAATQTSATTNSTSNVDAKA
jgi:hypothetical protein